LGKGHSRCLNRGGNWNNGEDNGVFSANLNNGRSNVNNNIGGRSAFRLHIRKLAVALRLIVGHVLRDMVGA